MTLRSRRAGALLALALAAACGDGTGPNGSLNVTLTANASEPAITLGSTGAPQTIACDLSFHARAEVRGDQAAEWGAGKLRFFAGGPGTPAVDSLVLSQLEVSRSFGNGVITGGQLQSSSWRATAARPFRVEGSFAYQVQGRGQEKTATATAVCAPGGTLTGGPAPTVADVSVTGPASDPQPGDTLLVSWTASSTAGLWEMGVQATGAFTGRLTIAGRGEKTVNHKLKLPIPAGAVLGVPVQLSVFAVDVNLQTASASVQQGPLVDRRPPTGFTAAGRWGDGRIGGQVGALDSLDLRISASDNHSLSHLVFEFPAAGVRDSVPLTAGAAMRDVSVSIPVPAWTGTTGVRLQVRDASGGRSAWVESESGAVRIFPTRAAVWRSAPISWPATEVAVAGSRAYVALGDRILVYTLPGLEPAGTVDVTSYPRALDTSLSGDSLIVALTDQKALGIVDLRAGNALTVVPMPQGVDRIWGVRVAANGKAMVLAENFASGSLIVEHNLRTGVQRVRTDAGIHPSEQGGVARSRDRSRLVVGSGCIYAAATDAFTCVPGGGGPLYGDRTGARWSRRQLVLDASLSLVRDLMGIVPVLASDGLLTSDGSAVWISAPRHLLRIDVATGQVVEGRPTPFFNGAWHATEDESVLVGISPRPDFGWQLVAVDLR